MKKVMTIMGTRPDIIRLSEIIKKVDRYYQHILVHTGQNFDTNLRDKFFKDLNLRLPDYQLNLKEKLVGMEFIGYMMKEVDKIIKKEKPQIIIILGDVSSALAAYVAKQLHVPVLHLEAGNRCYDDMVPEEINRRIIDSCSEYLLPYTQRSREQLLLEGYHPSKIIVLGNPIGEVLSQYINNIDEKKILKQYKVSTKKYILVTLHRTENITNKESLQSITAAINQISKKTKILLSVHPKLESMLKAFNIKLEKNVIRNKPFRFKEFVALMKNAKTVLSDSGTVPEECSILKVPVVLMRASTERPELLENNSMILSGIFTDDIIQANRLAQKLSMGQEPEGYKEIVSEKIIKILARKI
jgi:UDP-N-acetylglucosamine 2-epimerase (non-hydrolysing)